MREFVNTKKEVIHDYSRLEANSKVLPIVQYRPPQRTHTPLRWTIIHKVRFKQKIVDIPPGDGLSSIQKGRQTNASILCKVPHKKGNEGYQEHNHEEWEAGNSGCMPDMWHQDVQDRQELKLILGV